MKRLSVLFLLLLAGCGNNNDNAWLGYAEGDMAFVSAPQAGWVSRMSIQRGDWITPGKVLFTLDDTHETAVRDQAIANITQAKAELAQEQANLVYTQKTLQRQQGLARYQAGVATTLDQAQANYRQSLAHIEQLEGQIRQMEAALVDASYSLSQREVISLTTGRVQDIYFWPGEYAPAMTSVVEILPPENVYVRFFVPESEFAKVHLGQKVAISCDSCAKNMTATVTFIASQEEYTPPVIFSLESRQKLVFKIEARAPGGLKLNPGQPVEVRPF